VSYHYHDDPVEESAVRRILPKFIAASVLMLFTFFYYQTTLASNITLNANQSIEFGQSVSATAACAGSDNLLVTPKSSFVNAANGAGTYYLSSVQVAGIPASCNGKDFVISFYDSATGSSALPIFGENKNVATVYNNAGTFEQGFQGTGTSVSGASGAFTVTFMSPVARSIDAVKVTLQSTEHKDWAIASIAGGSSHTCTLLNSSAVKCWGVNYEGQLGDGTEMQRLTPVTVSGLSSGVRTIATRYDHTCALLYTGAVKCWGDNGSGQLGDGTKLKKSTPVAVSGLSSGVSAISAGNGHTCALLKSGAVKCWGGGGKTGDGTDTERTVPVDVFGLSSGVIAISAAGYHTCVLLSTGAVKCWGSEADGTTLGNGGGAINKPGGAISGFSADVIALAAGERHTCALLSTGGVQCFGENYYGQLGNGTKISSSTPVTVSGISNAVAISANGWTSCALLSTGEAKCWGQNGEGQLGDNSRTERLTPVTVSGLSSAVSMGNGYFHTCALVSSGAVKCWGSNVEGQLGNGTTTQSNTPVSVTGIP
jgi:alpha-tubulin suppressor-like RCC1 family protein